MKLFVGLGVFFFSMQIWAVDILGNNSELANVLVDRANNDEYGNVRLTEPVTLFGGYNVVDGESYMVEVLGGGKVPKSLSRFEPNPSYQVFLNPGDTVQLADFRHRGPNLLAVLTIANINDKKSTGYILIDLCSDGEQLPLSPSECPEVQRLQKLISGQTDIPDTFLINRR